MSSNASEPSEDVRVQRTRKQLADALIALLVEYPFDTISVSKICLRAEIHRSTFYTHFDNKYALLRFVLNDMQADLKRIYANIEQMGADTLFHHHIFDYVLAHKPLFKVLMVEQTADSLTALMRKEIAAMTESFAHEREQQGAQYRVPIEIVGQFFAGAVIAVLAWWMESDQPCAPAQLVDYLNDLLSNRYEL